MKNELVHIFKITIMRKPSIDDLLITTILEKHEITIKLCMFIYELNSFFATGTQSNLS